MLQVAISSWQWVFKAIAKLPLLFASALILFVMVRLAEVRLVLLAVPFFNGWTSSLDQGHVLAVQQLFSVVSPLGRVFIEAPLAIGIHRFILLDEAVDGVAVGFGRRSLRFVIWLLAVEEIMAVPGVFISGLLISKPLSILIGLPLLALGVIVVIRSALLFPAIAVDKFGSVLDAWNMTRLNAGRIMLTGTAAFAPLYIIFAFILVRTSSVGGHVDTTQSAAIFVSAFISMSSVAVFAAVASVYFQIYGPQLTPLGLGRRQELGTTFRFGKR